MGNLPELLYVLVTQLICRHIEVKTKKYLDCSLKNNAIFVIRGYILTRYKELDENVFLIVFTNDMDVFTFF